jgi:hypothetical protein
VTNPYQAVLELARQQAAAIARDDLDSALALLDTRADLLTDSPPATALEDRAAVEEVLRLDRQFSGVIRQRMLRLRDDAVQTSRGRTALGGYKPLRRASAQWLDKSG